MKSLGAIVRGRSLTELGIIAELWGAPAPASDDTNEAMAIERTMRDPIAARTAWENLGPDERKVLLAIVGPAARNWCAVDALPERAMLDVDRVDAALAQLRSLYIVEIEQAKLQGAELLGQRQAFYGYVTTRTQQEPVVEKPIAYVPTEIVTTLYATGRELAGAPPDRTTLTLSDLLMPYRQGDLDLIGRRFHMVQYTYCSRNEVRVLIAENVAQAEAVRFALTQIGPPLDEVYEWIIARGGRATLADLRKRMRWDVPTSLQAVRTFEEYAIAFDAFSDGERVLFIPARTFDNLRRANARPRAEVGLRERAAPRAIFPADSYALWDVAAFVAVLTQQEIELTRANILPKRVAQRVFPLLTNRDALLVDGGGYEYVSQLQFEAIDLGIAQIISAENRGVLAPGPKLDAWSRQDVRMQTHRLVRRWPQNRNWQDRAGRGFRGWMSIYINIAVARDALLSALKQCDPGVWYDVKSLLHTIQGDDPFILRPSQRFNGQGGFKMTDEARAHWDDTDGELLCGMLSSSLYDLGVVSLGYDTDAAPSSRLARNPDAFMLTELGAEVLKNDLGLAHVAADRALIVQPSFEVLLLEPHMPALYALLRFTQPEQFGRASRFKLTREALMRAISAGQSLDDITDFLKRHSQKDLPQNVLYTLTDWARHYKATVLSQVVLIEVDSEATADELCGSSRLRDLGLRRIGPRAIVTPDGAALRMVRRAIERAGYAVNPAPAASLAVTPGT